jgi:hypothetical protein
LSERNLERAGEPGSTPLAAGVLVDDDGRLLDDTATSGSPAEFPLPIVAIPMES